jgi:hypothetical protein
MVDPEAVLLTIIVSGLALILAGIAFVVGLFQKYPSLYAKLFGYLVALIPFILAAYRLWRVLPLRQ